jgi:diacylglycerol O-acyltransferase
MERLSTQDASFLYIENEFNHMSIAELALFEGPPPAADEFEAMVESKLDQVPRFRQRIRFIPFDLGRPVWCDDAHFSLRYHVRHSALPAPGSIEQLQGLVGRVMSQQLDRTKPLWEMWVIEGLADGGWAILMKIHHAVADGLAATDLLTALLDEDPSQPIPASMYWQPERQPSPPELAAIAVAERLTSPREGFDALRSALKAPGRAARRAGDFFDGLATYRRFANTALESSLNGPIGPHRSWRWVSASLADMKKIRDALGGTVNDVVLTAITLGFRALLLSRGEAVNDLSVRSLVPVSVRPREEHNVYNNRVSAMFAELPVGIEEATECLAAVSRQMNGLKKHHQSAAGETLASLSGLAPPLLLALSSRLFSGIRQHTVQTVTTNVPGPQQPLYAMGRRMRAAHLYVPLATSVRIGVAIFSYAGEISFAVTADYDNVQDEGVLCRGIEEGIADLLRAC